MRQLDSDVEFVLFPQRARRRRFWRRLRWLIASLFVLIGGGWLTFLEVQTFESQSISQRIAASTGIQVRVQRHSIGLGILELSGVSMSGKAQGTIAQVLTSFNFNPLLGRIGKPTDVTLRDFSLQLTPQTFSAVVDDTTSTVSKRSGLDMLPAKIRLAGGVFHFMFGPNQPTMTLEGIRGVVHTRTKTIEIDGRTLRIDNREIEQDVVAKVHRTDSGGLKIEISKRSPEPKHWWIHASIAKDLRFARVEFNLSSVSKSLAEYIERYVVDPVDLRVNGKAVIRMLPNTNDQLEVELESHARQLTVMVPQLAKRPVRLPALHLVSKLVLDASKRTVTVPHFLIAANPPAAKGRGPIRFVRVNGSASSANGKNWDVAMTLPDADCQDVLAIFPREILDDVADIRMRGKIGFHSEFAVSAESIDLRKFAVNGAGVNCDVESVPERFAKAKLRYTRSLEFKEGGRIGLANDSLTRSPEFVELEHLPEYLPKAFIHSEDRRFNEHSGFDLEGIRNALTRNFASGQLNVGGSTISQQLAKNLFFNGERTIARKVRETVLTWYLERYLNKSRILELYLNIVEFGPGVFGISNAAKFYFAKSPADLSPRESVFLTYMLPAPSKRFYEICTPTLRPKLDRIISAKIHLLEKANWISPEVAFKGKTENLHFSRASAIESQCNPANRQRLATASANSDTF